MAAAADPPGLIPNGGGGATEEEDEDEAEDENGDHSETGAEAEKAGAACVRIVDGAGLCSWSPPLPLLLLLLLLVTETAVDDEGGRVGAAVHIAAPAVVATGVGTVPNTKAPCCG
jgi:hypothetical protein